MWVCAHRSSHPPYTQTVAPHMQVCRSMIDLGRSSGHILNWSWFPLLPKYRPGVYHQFSVMFVCFNRSVLLWGEAEEVEKKGRRKKRWRRKSEGFLCCALLSFSHKSHSRRSGCSHSGKVQINRLRLKNFGPSQPIYVRCCHWHRFWSMSLVFHISSLYCMQSSTIEWWMRMFLRRRKVNFFFISWFEKFLQDNFVFNGCKISQNVISFDL